MMTHSHHLKDQVLHELSGIVHFIRVSMDGVEATYESIRGRPFVKLLERLKALRKIVSFGINFLVNAKTISDLDKAVKLAEDYGCSEFLLLPEEATLGAEGIDPDTRGMLQEWVAEYCGSIPLAVSESGADGLPICNPLGTEIGLDAFAHIDAAGALKRTSYDTDGVRITEDGVISALRKLAAGNLETHL